MQDFLSFKKMITPSVIQFLFWLGVLVVIIVGIVFISHRAVAYGILFIIVGPIIVRLYCEWLIVFFTINGTLTEVKNLLKERSSTQ